MSSDRANTSEIFLLFEALAKQASAEQSYKRQLDTLLNEGRALTFMKRFDEAQEQFWKARAVIMRSGTSADAEYRKNMKVVKWHTDHVRRLQKADRAGAEPPAFIPHTED